MTLPQVHPGPSWIYIWWSACGLATFHQEPMFTFVAAQNHLTGLQVDTEKKWEKIRHSWSVFLPIWVNFHELFAFNWNVLNFRSFCLASQLQNHQPTFAILEVLLLHQFLLLLIRSVTMYILFLPSWFNEFLPRPVSCPLHLRVIFH